MHVEVVIYTKTNDAVGDTCHAGARNFLDQLTVRVELARSRRDLDTQRVRLLAIGALLGDGGVLRPRLHVVGSGTGAVAHEILAVATNDEVEVVLPLAFELVGAPNEAIGLRMRCLLYTSDAADE